MKNEESLMQTKSKRRFRYVTTPMALAGLLAIGVAAPGCEDNALCCTESDFQVGGTIEIDGSAGVAVQAVADFGAIGSAIVDDLTTACRTMATDLEADADARMAAEATEDKRDKMNAWCNLAVSSIADLKAAGNVSLTIDFQPPVCEASVSAKANCQASCSGSAECDIQANPPTCEGGKLEVQCSGSCTAEAGATLTCEGSCSGECSGSCTADAGGVECAGKCEGTCSASAMGGGTGIQADGTCDGVCEGTCEVTAPSASCSGTCNGECSASCEASANASVKCDGTCEGDFEPISCKGGELSGGCEVEASCEANCDASVSAKASCSPPELTVAFTGDLEIGARLKLVVEANMGLVAAIGARLEGMAALAGTFSSNINGDVLAEIKPVCIPTVIAAAGAGVADVEASVTVSADLLGEVGM